MSEMKFGEVGSWDDVEVGGGSDFMQLKEGQNRVRVISKPYQFTVHWATDVTGSNRKVKCALQDCPLCKQGVKAQTRWYIGVIDRVDNKAKILEISAQIMKGLKNTAGDPDWGDPRKYDVNIQRGPKGAQPLYTVLPKPKVQVSDEDKVAIASFQDNTDLSKLCIPSTPGEVMKTLGGGVQAENPQQQPQQQASFVSESTSEDESSAPVVSDDDFSFDD